VAIPPKVLLDVDWLEPCVACRGTGRVPFLGWVGQKIVLWRWGRRYSR
jgi:hypothetical protein